MYNHAASIAATVIASLWISGCEGTASSDGQSIAVSSEQEEMLVLTAVNQFGPGANRSGREWANFVVDELCGPDRGADELIDSMRTVVPSGTPELPDTELLAIAFQLTGVVCPSSP